MVTVNVNAEEQAFENALMAMDADTSKTGLQLDIVNGALNELSSVIDVDGLHVKDQGVVDAIDGIPLPTTAQRVAEASAAAAITAAATTAAGAEVAAAVAAGSTAVVGAVGTVGTGIATLEATTLGVEAAILGQSHSTNVTVEPAAVTVTGPTATEIATAIAGQTLSVGGTVSVSNQPSAPTADDIAQAIAGETLNVTGTVEVSNHPTSIGVNNHPTYAGPTADDIADAIEGKTLTTKLAGNVAGATTTVAVDGDFPTATAIAEAISDSNGSPLTIIGATNTKFIAMKLINGQESTVHRQYVQMQDLSTVDAQTVWDPIMMVGMKVYLHSNSNTFVESYDAAAPAPSPTPQLTIQGIDYSNDRWVAI